MRSSRVVVVSLNTAWEALIHAPRWRRGSVVRVAEAITFAGGKPLNILRLCISMAVDVELVALADGGLAERVTAMCDDAGVPVDVIVTETPSRTTAVIVEAAGRATVFNGQGIAPREDQLERCLLALDRRLGRGDVLVVAGSFPQPVPPDLVSRLAALAGAKEARFLLDTSGAPLEAGLAAGADIVKTNEHELAAVRSAPGRVATWPGLRRLAPEPANLVVTASRRGLRGWDDSGCQWLVRPPAIKATNTVGAGDAVAAGMAAALARGGSFRDSIIEGTAWAAARAERYDFAIAPERVAELAAQTRVQEVAAASEPQSGRRE
jgi:1-phosphofructokinase family hexose kinase